MALKSVRQRRMQANYLDIGTAEEENFVLMGTGFTDLNEEPGAQTSSKRYVNDASTSKGITGYEWQDRTQQTRFDQKRRLPISVRSVNF